MNKAETLVSAEEVLARINEAVKASRTAVSFKGEVIEAVKLTDQEVPISLDFMDAHIQGNIHLQRSTFHGSYIELSGARIDGDLCLNGLESTRNGYSLFLRKAHVEGEVFAEYTKLNVLCIGGLTFGGQGSREYIYLEETLIKRGVSLDPYYD